MVSELKDVECSSSGKRTAERSGQAEASAGTILLADDDTAVRAFVNSVLQHAGYQILLAENSRKALEICTTHEGVIQALVTDLVMPEINGRELAERARLVRPDLKVLFISGYVDRGPKDGDAANPASSFLEKPFTSESLLQAVEHLCAVAPAKRLR